MAKIIVPTLSPALARDLPEVRRRVLGQGASTAATPYKSGERQIWMELVGYSVNFNDQMYRWKYNTELFASPFATTPIPNTLYGETTALNTWEVNNTNTLASGYEIYTGGVVACGLLYRIEPIPLRAARYLCKGPYKCEVDNKYHYEFTERNDPTYSNSAGG